MNEGTFVVLAVMVGGAVAWILASAILRSRYEERIRDAEALKIEAEASARNLRAEQIKDEAELKTLRSSLAAEQAASAAANASLEAERKNLAEQCQLLDDARAKLSESFKAISGDVLGSQTEAFLQVAAEKFNTLRTGAEGDLAKRQEAIDGLVNPLREALERYERGIQEMEKAREHAYGSLNEQLRTLAAINQQLQKETGTLSTALKGGPQVRGRWGEMTLRRAVELAGMSEYCDFTEQETLATESGKLRPDMIVNLPGGRRIAVDAKVPLQSFLDAASAETEAERADALKLHGQRVRGHMNQLAAKAYWDQFDGSVELVVLFLPGESFFSAALEQDRTLIEDGMAKHIVLATPTTLIALLRAVAYGWRQKKMEENAREISALGKQVYDRLRPFLSHFDGVGRALAQAVNRYNDATGSLERSVLPAARRFRELGATGGEELAPMESVDEVPRALSAPERTAMLETESQAAPDAAALDKPSD